MAKLNFPSIEVCKPDLQSLHRTVEQLRICVGLLTRQRGDETSWPPTIDELRRMGIVPKNMPLPDTPEGKK